MEAKHIVKVVLMLWIVQPPFVNTLMVLKSLEPLDKPDPFPGIELKKYSILKDSKFSKGITFCGRFYFLRYQEVLLEIGLANPLPFIKIWRGKVYKNFFLLIGGLWFEIKDVQNENKQLWITNQWQHFCLAFSVDTSHIYMVKVIILQLFYCLVIKSQTKPKSRLGSRRFFQK